MSVVYEIGITEKNNQEIEKKLISEHKLDKSKKLILYEQ